MKSSLRVFLHASPFLLMVPALSASAEDRLTTEQVVSAAATREKGALRIESARATELKGQEVRNAQGERLAVIDDLLIDLENGRIVAVVLSPDAKAENRREVPPQTFGYISTVGDKTRVLQWRGDTAKLTGAPRFAPPGANRPSQSVHVSEVYRYYGEDTYFVVADQSPKKTNNVHTHANVDQPDTRVPLGRVILASDLLKLDVRDAMDEKVGAVEDLIIDIPAGRVVAIVISSGGFLGLGDSLSAVPPSTIRYVAEDKNELRVTLSKETLKSAPRYRADDATKFNDITYTDGVYRSYQVEPYSTVVDADNTRRNVRDRDGVTLTPLDQGNSASDLDISARIRRDIVAQTDFSVTAKNVKIITRDGVVTLRGPVRNSDEKRVIEAIALREAGDASRVSSQLEIIAK